MKTNRWLSDPKYRFRIPTALLVLFMKLNFLEIFCVSNLRYAFIFIAYFPFSFILFVMVDLVWSAGLSCNMAICVMKLKASI